MNSTEERDLETGRQESRYAGFMYATSAYVLWGASVVYWKWLVEANAIEVLSHRVVWAWVMLGAFLFWRGHFRQILDLLKSWKKLRLLFLTSVLLAINWSIFVWSVLNDHILEASIGYYINPLISVMLGVFLLSERINRRQVTAVILAAIGVSGLIIWTGAVPWLALSLAISWGLYGYVRKIAGFVAMNALLVELGICVPFALALIAHVEFTGAGSIGTQNTFLLMLLLGGGLITLLPLVFFGEGVARVPLSTIGILQYVAPSMQLVLAVLIYGEPLTNGHIFAFSFIWMALLLYSFDALSGERARRRAGQANT